MRLLTQLILVIVGLLIVFMYIQPQFMQLQAVQQETVQFGEAVAKATQFNDQLNRLLNQADTMSPADRATLNAYLPIQVDTVAVARDIENLAVKHQVEVLSITTESLGSDIQADTITQDSEGFGAAAQRDIRDQLQVQTVQVSLVGSYESFKAFLRATEANAYPMPVTSLSVSPQVAELAGPDVMQYEITFAVYSLAES